MCYYYPCAKQSGAGMMDYIYNTLKTVRLIRFQQKQMRAGQSAGEV
jgi:hypothetical protein